MQLKNDNKRMPLRYEGEVWGGESRAGAAGAGSDVKSLAVMIFANPERDFVKSTMVPLFKYLNYRSGNLLIRVPGYQVDQPVEATDAAAVPTFNNERYVRSIAHFEKLTGLSFAGRTAIVLFVQRTRLSGLTQADFSYLLQIDIEGLLNAHVIDKVEGFFEELIQIAQKEVADDAIFATKDAVKGPAIESSILGAISSHFLTSGVREGAQKISAANKYIVLSHLKS